ncbi:tubulin binding cofactor A [Hygrophoropsis aurantiaca]|uniref:Tubulin binding cofactor A n=1 Tax=Hygrophoropsis aurantiaca TaxID=72124 RepID=A0ACB8A1M2_9AGAM|nr:tubulin binding cofactor A [Hygrophoropsis aurantiaca]
MPAQDLNDPKALARQLKTKSKTAQRLLQDYTLYGKEEEEQKLKVDKMVADNGDEYELRNARKILDESNRMIKDSETRLGNAVQELRGLVVRVRSSKEVAQNDELNDELIHAEEALEAASL